MPHLRDCDGCRGPLACNGFLTTLCDVFPPEEWRRLLATSLYRLPGLGGIQGFEAMTYDEVNAAIDVILADIEARKKAMKK